MRKLRELRGSLFQFQLAHIIYEANPSSEFSQSRVSSLNLIPRFFRPRNEMEGFACKQSPQKAVSPRQFVDVLLQRSIKHLLHSSWKLMSSLWLLVVGHMSKA